MSSITSVIYNVAILFLMMIPGVIIKKCKFAPVGFGKGLSNLVLYIAQPALIFLAYVRPYDKEVLINSLWVLGFSLLAHVIFALVAGLFFKNAPDSRRRMLRFATIFSNAAFMGIPLIEAVFPGGDVVIYASIYNISFNLFLWTLGVHICTNDRDYNGDGVVCESEEKKSRSHSQASIKKALIHPVTIAAAIGLVFFFSSLDSHVPELVIDSLTMLKNLVAPLSMVVLGLRLAELDFKSFFNDKNMYIFLALRHIVLPLVLMGIFRLVNLIAPIDYQNVYMVTLIMAATPAASSATMFAEKYDCDAVYVSRLVVVSTLLSIATLPLIIWIGSLGF